jgi:archaellum biogenesis protein FlaJ (TadC family)
MLTSQQVILKRLAQLEPQILELLQLARLAKTIDTVEPTENFLDREDSLVITEELKASEWANETVAHLKTQMGLD